MLSLFGRAGLALVLAAVLALGAVVFAREAAAADIQPMVTKAAPAPLVLPAVDGFNAKFDGFGGEAAHRDFYGVNGSFSVPLGQQFGLQVDGLASSFRGDFLGGVATHAFWRNPSQGLFGFYGDYVHWNRLGGVNAYHFGAEGAVYLGRVTIEGILGVETGSTATATVGGIVETIDIKSRFFDKIDVAYYFTDDVKAYIGHRYLGGKHTLALGGEWALPTPVSAVRPTLFVEGRLGRSESNSVWAGLRVYLGQRPKTLIRRHREDDPVNGLNDAASTFGNAGSSTAAPAPGLTCPPRFEPIGGVCVPR
jgi:hypothetical protein